MDVLSIVFIILPLFLCDSCSAQVKNASLPLVIWHGMGRCVIYRVSQVCREGKVMRTTSGRCNLRNRGTNVKTVSCIIKSYTVCGIFSFLALSRISPRVRVVSRHFGPGTLRTQDSSALVPKAPRYIPWMAKGERL